MAELGLEPGEELAQIALVGIERVGGGAPLMLQMGEPGANGRAQVLAERQRAVVEDVLDARALHGFPVRRRAVATITPQGLMKY